MSNTTLRKRLAELEASHIPPVYGIQEPAWDGTDTNSVHIAGTEDYMTLEEWNTRYPHGTLIRVVYCDPDEMEGA